MTNDIKKRISELKKQRRHVKFKKLAYKIDDHKLTLIALATPLVFGGIGFSIAGHSPFYRNEVTRNLHTQTIISEDKVIKTSQYKSFGDEEGSLVYYTGWENNGEEYVTNVYTYDVSGLTSDEVVELNDEVLGEPISHSVITSDTMPEGIELGKSYYEGVIYDTNKDDYIITPETDKELKKDISFYVMYSITCMPLGFFLEAYPEDNTTEYLECDAETVSIDREIEELKKQKTKKKVLRKDTV